jgi:AcrR family transcriptional regulator
MTSATRRWAKTDATQQRILDAATEVFAARGFTAATMADIVDHSGASIGSIYHHFGGKKELFLAIFERLAAVIDRQIDAVADKSGELYGQLAFEANARAYLNAIWANRRAAMVLATRLPASTGSAAAACSRASAAGCRCSSSTLRREVSY